MLDSLQAVSSIFDSICFSLITSAFLPQDFVPRSADKALKKGK